MLCTKNMPDMRLVFTAFRPSFLLLSVACFLLGLEMAAWSNGESGVNVWSASLVFFGALSAHMSTNGLNEYFDFRSGLDEKTVSTPLNGGSGVLIARPDLAPIVLGVSIGALLISIIIGLWFVWLFQSWILLLIGVFGVGIIIMYTPYLTHSAFACFVVPGIGFGMLMTGGAYFVLTGYIGWAITIATLVLFFLVNNLLLLNQIPDSEADRAVGRRHIPIRVGERKSLWFYGASAILAAGALLLGIVTNIFPVEVGLGLFSIVPAALVIWGMSHFEADAKQRFFFLSVNVGITVITPVLMAIGFLIDRLD